MKFGGECDADDVWAWFAPAPDRAMTRRAEDIRNTAVRCDFGHPGGAGS